MCVDSNSSSPTVTHVIPEGQQVYGVTSLGDDVFVVRYDSQKKIEVYDANTFTLQRRITVPGLGISSFGLAACPYNNCLYASDYDNASVHRVDLSLRGSNAVKKWLLKLSGSNVVKKCLMRLSGSNAVMKWSVASCPAGLSVNSEHNLLVVSVGEHKLQIFTTHGTLLQNIQLQADIESPRCAVQLSTGQFLVSHSDSEFGKSSLHRICSVGVDGAVVRSYGAEDGCQLTQLRWPAGLAVDREGHFLVADIYNHRLLVIDQSLTSGHEMSVCVDKGLKCPFALWYDQSRRRLYVGERDWKGGRVIIIDNLKDFTASQLKA